MPITRNVAKWKKEQNKCDEPEPESNTDENASNSSCVISICDTTLRQNAHHGTLRNRGETLKCENKSTRPSPNYKLIKGKHFLLRRKAREDLDESASKKLKLDVSAQSKAIRNRPKSSNRDEKIKEGSSVDGRTRKKLCLWTNCCTANVKTDITEHIKTIHVRPQVKKENFVCLWEGCKVYNRPSCSLSWLDGHVITHGGGGHFSCILENCGQQFNSQVALEKHVDAHFTTVNECAPTLRCTAYAHNRNFKKKKMKIRKSYLVEKNEDIFDERIMEFIRYSLTKVFCASNWHLVSYRNSRFSCRVKARRVKCGKVEFLVEWVPKDFLPEFWVSEVPLSSAHGRVFLPMSPSVLQAAECLSDWLFASSRDKSHRNLRKRKPAFV